MGKPTGPICGTSRQKLHTRASPPPASPSPTARPQSSPLFRPTPKPTKRPGTQKTSTSGKGKRKDKERELTQRLRAHPIPSKLQVLQRPIVFKYQTNASASCSNPRRAMSPKRTNIVHTIPVTNPKILHRRASPPAAGSGSRSPSRNAQPRPLFPSAPPGKGKPTPNSSGKGKGQLQRPSATSTRV
ncbi:hypothetical protein C8Q74DRAFT_1216025 [Fomes fomentarius]|nr:hypothetical protein C8Q74DRAFT_1216025 [Fomes fomentarius]